jgi:hypothetical protein
MGLTFQYVNYIPLVELLLSLDCFKHKQHVLSLKSVFADKKTWESRISWGSSGTVWGRHMRGKTGSISLEYFTRKGQN